MLRGAIGSLTFMARRWWPGLDIKRAVWALEMVEEQIDAAWWDEKIALQDKTGEDKTGEAWSSKSECGKA